MISCYFRFLIFSLTCRKDFKTFRVPNGEGWGGGEGEGLWSPGALKCLSWCPEPKASLDLEPDQKCCFWLNGVKQWSLRAPNFPSWNPMSPGALHCLVQLRGIYIFEAGALVPWSPKPLWDPEHWNFFNF